jgi:hypothetical protein
MIPYIGLYLSRLDYISELYELFVDPWLNEMYNLNRILAAGNQVQTFFEYTSKFKDNFSKKRIVSEELCSIICAYDVHPETLYFKSMAEKPLQATFRWDLSSWPTSKIKTWCETECSLRNTITINRVISGVKKNGILTSENLRDAGIKSFLDRRVILKAQKQQMIEYTEDIKIKPLQVWATEDLCFWLYIREYPKTVRDAVFSAGWNGETLSDKIIMSSDKKMIWAELGIDNLQLCHNLLADFEHLRNQGGISEDEVKHVIAKLDKLESEEKLAFRRNSLYGDSNFVVPSTCRTNSDSQVTAIKRSLRISSFAADNKDRREST